jgi:hypothetical protein
MLLASEEDRLAYRTRLFIDFWDFSLNWRDRAGADKVYWTKVPRVLLDESTKKLEAVGIVELLALEETLVYASYNPKVDGKLKAWLNGFWTSNRASGSMSESGGRRAGRCTARAAVPTTTSARAAALLSRGHQRREWAQPSSPTSSRWPPKAPMTSQCWCRAMQTTYPPSNGYKATDGRS